MNKRQTVIIGIFVLLSLVVGYIVLPDLKARLKIGADTLLPTKTVSITPTIVSTPDYGTTTGTPPPSGGGNVPTTTVSLPPGGGASTPTTTVSLPPGSGGNVPTTTVPGGSAGTPTATVSLPPGGGAGTPTTTISSPPSGGGDTPTPFTSTTTASKTLPINITFVADPKPPQNYDRCVGDICWGISVDCIGGDCLPPQEKEPEDFFVSDPPQLKEQEEIIRQKLAAGPEVCKDKLADCNDPTVASLCSVCTQKDGLIESDAPLVVFDIKTKLRSDPYNTSKYIAEVTWRTNKPATGQVAYIEATKRTTAYSKKTLEDTQLSNFHRFIFSVRPHSNYHFAVGSRTANEKMISNDFELLSGRYYDNLWDVILKIISISFR
ncbi:MAG TPA: hypothetical protein PLX55_02345 [bacterium]|jgi:hypothetical protein|nr:hypothetical protein [bacterium]